jgi:hypothetical protein
MQAEALAMRWQESTRCAFCRVLYQFRRAKALQ